jgi:DNA adenine methylase
MALGGPLRYFGSKHRFGNRFAALIPEHRIYVEPFVGSGGVFWARERQRARFEAISDLHEPLINFYRHLRSDPETLAKCCAIYEREGKVPLNYSPEQFKFWQTRKVKDTEHQKKVLATIEQQYGHGGRRLYEAAMYYFTNRQAYSGTSLSWVGNHKRDLYEKRVREFVQFAAWLRSVSISHAPYSVSLLTYNRPDAFVYADPPYIGEARGRDDPAYHHEMLSPESHEPLLEMLVRFRGKVMLSGYAHPLYEKTLKGWRRLSFAARTMRTQSGTGKRTEMLWLNY